MLEEKKEFFPSISKVVYTAPFLQAMALKQGICSQFA